MAKRSSVVALAPSYETINDTTDAYMQPLPLRVVARESGRYWKFHDQPTTVALTGNRFAKSLAPFTSHTDEPSFRELLRECSDNGIPRPSGYCDVFHERFHSPRVNWSANEPFAAAFCGGWQQAISPGGHIGTFYKYDLRSAYLWAASLGLPDTRTYRRTDDPFGRKTKGRDGLYRIKLVEPCKGAPFPYQYTRECIATNIEIETYGLRIAEVIDGVCWSRMSYNDEITTAVRSVSFWKQAGRAYWGRWAQMQKLTCVANGRTWTLGNAFLNIPWAHLIVSRVKMRVWNFSSNAVHVYVDSIITRDTLPTGLAIGDWRLEKTYEHGVIVRGPGQYGAINSPTLDRMAGVGKGSVLRNTTVAERAGCINDS